MKRYFIVLISLLFLGCASTNSTNSSNRGVASVANNAVNSVRNGQGQTQLIELPGVSFLDIAKDSDGNVTLTTMSKAENYCYKSETHLPSARELAQLSKSFGARGIVDSCGSDKLCSRIDAENEDGTRDGFYFSYAGYQRPSRDLGKNPLWSSSLVAGMTELVFSLEESTGDIVVTNRNFGQAFRCAKYTQGGPTPRFLDIARDSSGKVKNMNRYDAVEYCKKKGARLPTARELAQLSMSLGARGIVDTCGSDKKCGEISDIDEWDSGRIKSFYFSYSGYQRPADDQGWNWFWSSSVYSGQVPDSGFALSGQLGYISYLSLSDFAAVRCVPIR